MRSFRLNHVAQAFVNHELLVWLEVSQVVRQHVDEVMYVWLNVGGLITLGEHVLGEASDLQKGL